MKEKKMVKYVLTGPKAGKTAIYCGVTFRNGEAEIPETLHEAIGTTMLGRYYAAYPSYEIVTVDGVPYHKDNCPEIQKEKETPSYDEPTAEIKKPSKKASTKNPGEGSPVEAKSDKKSHPFSS